MKMVPRAIKTKEVLELHVREHCIFDNFSGQNMPRVLEKNMLTWPLQAFVLYVLVDSEDGGFVSDLIIAQAPQQELEEGIQIIEARDRVLFENLWMGGVPRVKSVDCVSMLLKQAQIDQIIPKHVSKSDIVVGITALVHSIYLQGNFL
mmetsp:Transcript_21300/g.30053  ORF Transcript_21300/g.30053 Transcript_21300/m.30053 type:complete len:148 (-) Transcript_21300:547-990(-)